MTGRKESKLLHVLGGGEWQVPTIKLAKSLGHRVLVTDMFLDRPGYAFADYHEKIDITDLGATLTAAARWNVDGIICDTTDVGVPTAAYVAEKLGLPGIGYETAINFSDKYRMRTLVRDRGLGGPDFGLAHSVAELEQLGERLGYPFVVKPTDSQSSRGVRRVVAPSMLTDAFVSARAATRRDYVLAESFLPGVEVTVEACVINGKVHVIGISDKIHYAGRPEVASRLAYPPEFCDEVLEKIKELNSSVTRALGLQNGVTHAEYMVDGERVSLVEIAARGGGSRVYSHIVPHLGGVDIPGAYISFCLGTGPLIAPAFGPRAAILEFFDFPSGEVRSISGLDEARAIKDVSEVFLEVQVGDRIREPDDDRSRPGFMLILSETRDEALAAADAVRRTIKIDVES